MSISSEKKHFPSSSPSGDLVGHSHTEAHPTGWVFCVSGTNTIRTAQKARCITPRIHTPPERLQAHRHAHRLSHRQTHKKGTGRLHTVRIGRVKTEQRTERTLVRTNTCSATDTNTRSPPTKRTHVRVGRQSPATFQQQHSTLPAVVTYFYGVCGFVLCQGFVLSMFWIAVGVMAGCVFWVLFCSVL